MGALFGKSKKLQSRITQHDKSILQMKQTRDKVKQYQKRLEEVLKKDRELAKFLLKEGKKDRAKLLLKKKRYQEQMLLKTDKQLENLEILLNDIEFSQIETQVFEGLKIGNEALKKINEVLNIDDIEKMLEETKEGIDKQQEINDLLSGAFTEEDEADFEQELEEMVKLELPEVPSDEIQTEERVEDDKKIRQRESHKDKIAIEAT